MTRYCDVTGCGRTHNARGYCLAHYKRWRKGENLGSNARNRSGVRGVSWYSRGQKWMAKATSGGRQYYLGYYEDIRDAERAVSAWRQEHMPFSEMDKKKETA